MLVEGKLAKREVFRFYIPTFKWMWRNLWYQDDEQKEKRRGLTCYFTKLAFYTTSLLHSSLRRPVRGMKNQWRSYLYANFYGMKGEYSDAGESTTCVEQHIQTTQKHNIPHQIYCIAFTMPFNQLTGVKHTRPRTREWPGRLPAAFDNLPHTAKKTEEISSSRYHPFLTLCATYNRGLNPTIITLDSFGYINLSPTAVNKSTGR